jgi:hypothetical protein
LFTVTASPSSTPKMVSPTSISSDRPLVPQSSAAPRYLSSAICRSCAGELAGLRWDRVDLMRRSLQVIEQRQSNHGKSLRRQDASQHPCGADIGLRSRGLTRSPRGIPIPRPTAWSSRAPKAHRLTSTSSALDSGFPWLRPRAPGQAEAVADSLDAIARNACPRPSAPVVLIGSRGSRGWWKSRRG